MKPLIVFIIFIFFLYPLFSMNKLKKSDVYTMGNNVIVRLIFSEGVPVYRTLRAGQFFQIDFLGASFSGEKSYPVYKNNLKLYRIIPIINEDILRVRLVLFKKIEPRIKKGESELEIIVPYKKEYKNLDSTIDSEGIAAKLYLKALDFMKNEAWDDALHYLEQARKKAPENARINEAYNLCLKKMKKFDEMKGEYERAKVFFNNLEYDKAINILEPLCEKFPLFYEARELLASAYFKNRNYELAVKTARKILSDNPLYDKRDYLLSIVKRGNEYQRINLGINTITFSCQDEPIEDVLYALSKDTGLKFSYHGPDDLRVSIDLHSATVDELLDELFGKHGLEYEIKNGIVKVFNAKISKDIVKNIKFYLPLGSTLKALAQLMKINIIINPEVDTEKQVNISIENNSISKNDLFNLILKNNNLVKIPYNDTTFFIVPKNIAKKYRYQRRFFKIFHLNNIMPEELLAVLKSMKDVYDRLDFENIVVVDLDDRSNIIATRSNMVYRTKYKKEDIELVKEITKELQEVYGRDKSDEGDKDGGNDNEQELLSKEERLLRQKKVEDLTRLIGEEKAISELVDPMKPNLGTESDADSKSNENIGKHNMFQRKVKAILAYETKENIELLERLIKDLDIKRPQVLIAVKIIDINKVVNEKLGLLPEFYDEVEGVYNSDKIRVKKLRDMSRIQLDATLDFLETHNKVKTLANPTIRVLDGQESVVDTSRSINIKTIVTDNIERVAYIDGTTTTVNDTINMIKYDSRNVGITMKLIPYISNNNEITLALDIKQSEKIGKSDTSFLAYLSSLDATLGKNPINVFPDVIETRNFSTYIRVRDSETVVIGGLISSRNNVMDEKTPFMSKLPIIGRFFSRKTKTQTRSEMVILLTPYLVNKDLPIRLAKQEEELKSASFIEFMNRLRRSIR